MMSVESGFEYRLIKMIKYFFNLLRVPNGSNKITLNEEIFLKLDLKKYC